MNGRPLRVGLFIPCYVDHLYPEVGLATVDVLRRFGVEVEFPFEQTCCGQPMANTGCTEDTRPFALKFLRIFKDFPHVVCPSGSCVSMVRHHYDQYLAGMSGFEELKKNTFELCEFLLDVLQVDSIGGRFPHRVGLHNSCHGHRALRLGAASELMVPKFNKVRQLLATIDGIQFTELSRPDECCGFGGTFSVNEEAISSMMGMDRLRDHLQAGTEVITAADMSCLMHMQALIRRNNMPLRVMHVAQIFAGQQLDN